jgi:ABC-2 type transport system permease protein
LGKASRLAALVALDASDTLRPPGFDVMLFIVSAVGAALAVIQPLTSPVAVANAVLDPVVVFAVSLYLAMRASSGIALLASTGVLQVYMAYPISRLELAAALLASRVLAPIATLVGAPLAVAAIALPGAVARGPADYVAQYLAYTLHLTLYGVAFALIALAARSPGTSSIASLTFFFLYTGLYLLLTIASVSLGSTLLRRLAEAMLFYRVTSDYLSGLHVEPWQFLLVPGLLSALLAAYFYVVDRRFEPP